MKEKEYLDSILQTSQMGQIGIRCVSDKAVRLDLKKDLAHQQKEYQEIETQARTLARSRGWHLKDLNPAVRSMSEMMTRIKLTGMASDSKIADMMITGSTKGIIRGIQCAHNTASCDNRIRAMGEKLVSTESRNIDQMKSYL